MVGRRLLTFGRVILKSKYDNHVLNVLDGTREEISKHYKYYACKVI